jgi:ketosteroid isomerase-like protein
MRVTAAFFCVLAYAGFALAQQTSDHRQIEQLIAQYAKSIDGADTTLAAEIWSQSPDVSFIHPLGHEHGFGAVKQNVYVRLMGENFSERKLSTKDVRISVHGDSAWAEFYWDFVAKLRRDGSPLNTKGRETQIYRKEPGGWRLVHVHYSGMPAETMRRQ